MKRLFITLLLCLMSASYVDAQGNMPYWVNSLPIPENETYYFRVTHAEGTNYEKAYVKAFSMAIMESSWKTGLPVDAMDDIATIEKGVESNLSIRSHQSNIALNKVCEYQYRSESTNKIVLYVLWQVAAAGNKDPQFEEFNKCR